MELSKEKIDTNYIKFIESGNKVEVMNPELMETLGEEMVKAPCTTSLNFYGAFEGGLVNHILSMTKFAIGVNESLDDDKQVSKKELIRVCLLHQIGKATMFEPQDNDWFIKNKGETFKFKKDVFTLKTGERSVYLAMKCGIKLTEDEVFAILNQDIDFTHREVKSKGEKLASILKISNLITILNSK